MDLGGFSIGNWGEETYCFNRSVREGGGRVSPEGEECTMEEKGEGELCRILYYLLECSVRYM